MTTSNIITSNDTLLREDNDSPVLRVLGGYFASLADKRRAQEEVTSSTTGEDEQ